MGGKIIIGLSERDTKNIPSGNIVEFIKKLGI